MCNGSRKLFRLRINAISIGDRDNERKSRFCKPMPCSAEIDPPSAASGS